MSDITKEELMAMIEVQGKTAAAMENIANSMRVISETNKEIQKSQTEFIQNCTEGRQECRTEMCTEIEKKLQALPFSTPLARIETKVNTIEKDSLWVKIVVSAVALISIIVTVLINTMTSHTATTRNKIITQDNIDILKKMEVVLENHLEQTKSDATRKREIDAQYKAIMEKK